MAACWPAALALWVQATFFEPTLLSDVPRDSSSAKSDLTGPVGILFRARDLADAISIANGMPLAGASSVWTREPAEQQQLIAAIKGRSVTLNAAPRQNGPLVMEALRDYMEGKTVNL